MSLPESVKIKVREMIRERLTAPYKGKVVLLQSEGSKQ